MAGVPKIVRAAKPFHVVSDSEMMPKASKKGTVEAKTNHGPVKRQWVLPHFLAFSRQPRPIQNNAAEIINRLVSLV